MYGRGPRPPKTAQTPPKTAQTPPKTAQTGHYGDEEEYKDVAFTMKLGPRGLRMGIWDWNDWPRAYNIYDVFGAKQDNVEDLRAKIDKAHDVLDTVTYGIQKKAEPVIITYKNITGMILSQDPGEMGYLRHYTPETLRKYLLRTKDNMNAPL